MSHTRRFSPGRRAVLRSAAAMGIAFLPGCVSWFRRKPEFVCPGAPAVSFPRGPLTIDAHCHVFNGTDLQVKDFVSMVVANQDGPLGDAVRLLASLLQELAWTAPTGEEELATLDEIARDLPSCSDGRERSRLEALRQEGYGRGRARLREAIRAADEFRGLRDTLRQKGVRPLDFDQDSRARVDAIQYIESLPDEVDDYRSDRRQAKFADFSLRGPSVRGLIDFVIQNFQYRYVSVHDYLRDYNRPGTRVVDLMLPALVDYDWWLSRGSTTKTPLRAQMDVMHRIAIVTGGRVHGMIAFDPLREVAWELGHADEGSFRLVTDAIEQHGFVGVKLYPPMGFAVLGNADLSGPGGSNFWARKWLPDWMDRPDLGEKLDAAMSKLLGWCQQNDVPVMAHTNITNGVTRDFEALAGAKYWARALAEYPRLKASFGHFGGASSVKEGLERARAFAGLMSADATASGAFAYADAGFFVEVMKTAPVLQKTLEILYEETSHNGNAALANRFMYGTDWEMTLTEGSVDTYLDDFIRLFKELEQRPAFIEARLTNLSGRFLGTNAVGWIGLRKDGAARQRLDAFYAANRVPTPDWMTKVDALT